MTTDCPSYPPNQRRAPELIQMSASSCPHKDLADSNTLLVFPVPVVPHTQTTIGGPSLGGLTRDLSKVSPLLNFTTATPCVTASCFKVDPAWIASTAKSTSLRLPRFCLNNPIPNIHTWSRQGSANEGVRVFFGAINKRIFGLPPHAFDMCTLQASQGLQFRETPL